MQPDRHAVRVKLLEIFVAARRQGVVHDDGRRPARPHRRRGRGLGKGHQAGPRRRSDHPMFAGAAMSDTSGADRRQASASIRTPRAVVRRRWAVARLRDSTSVDCGGADSVTDAGPPLTKMVVDTRMTGADTTMSVGDTKMPADTKMSGPMTTSAPTTQFRATLPGGQPTTGLTPPAPAPAPGATPDFASLDFDLGPTKMNLEPPTKMPTSMRRRHVRATGLRLQADYPGRPRRAAGSGRSRHRVAAHDTCVAADGDRRGPDPGSRSEYSVDQDAHCRR